MPPMHVPCIRMRMSRLDAQLGAPPVTPLGVVPASSRVQCEMRELFNRPPPSLATSRPMRYAQGGGSPNLVVRLEADPVLRRRRRGAAKCVRRLSLRANRSACEREHSPESACSAWPFSPAGNGHTLLEQCFRGRKGRGERVLLSRAGARTKRRLVLKVLKEGIPQEERAGRSLGPTKSENPYPKMLVHSTRGKKMPHDVPVIGLPVSPTDGTPTLGIPVPLVGLPGLRAASNETATNARGESINDAASRSSMEDEREREEHETLEPKPDDDDMEAGTPQTAGTDEGRITATLIPVRAPPEPPPQIFVHSASTPHEQMMHLLSTQSGNRWDVWRRLVNAPPSSLTVFNRTGTVIIASPPPDSGLPTLVAQQMPDGTFLVQEIPVRWEGALLHHHVGSSNVPRCTSPTSSQRVGSSSSSASYCPRCGWCGRASFPPLLDLHCIPTVQVGTFLPFCTHNHNDR